MPNLKKRLRGLWTDESGISGAEYCLLLALIGGFLILGASELGFAMMDKLVDTAVCLQTDGATC